MPKHHKRYKTPQAVNDFIRQFRKDAIRTIRASHGLDSEAEKALEANVERLREFLLSRCDTIRPPAPGSPQEPVKVMEEGDEDEWEEEFSLFPKPKPQGGWTW